MCLEPVYILFNYLTKKLCFTDIESPHPPLGSQDMIESNETKVPGELAGLFFKILHLTSTFNIFKLQIKIIFG